MGYINATSASRTSDLWKALRPSPLATVLAAAIVFSWAFAAMELEQSIFAVQRSRGLLRLGAIDGELLRNAEWWRLLTSQFLHVQPPHMLFNALCVLAIGSLIESRRNWWSLVLIFLVGGTIGQVASVIAYPDLVSSGASQALMALCGAALLLCFNRRERWLVLAILTVQFGLDLHAAQKIKAGHTAGFLAGVFIACALLAAAALTPPNNSLERSRDR